MPNLSGMSKKGNEETLSIFKYIIGKTKKIAIIDKKNRMVEITFRILKGKNKGLHSIYIEPFLLEKIKN